MLRVIERNEMTFVTYYSSQLPQLPKSFEELDVFCDEETVCAT